MRLRSLHCYSRHKISAALTCLLWALWLTTSAPAQNLSTSVFPTEEELFEAFSAGDISFDEYITLQDIFSSVGVSASDTLSLLRLLGADFPNLDFIAGLDSADFDSLQSEQFNALLEPSATRRPVSAKARIYTDQEFTGERRSRDNYQIALDFQDRWSFTGAIGGTYTQPVVWKSRSLRYRPRNSIISTVTAGAFDYRPALGLAIGRRGRLIERPPALSEDFSFNTDRGGLDGVFVEGAFSTRKNKNKRWTALYSRRSDTTHVISALAGSLAATLGKLEIETLSSHGVVSRKDSNGRFQQWQQSFSAAWKSHRALTRLEVNTQSNEGALATALALETRVRLTGTNTRLAIWRYPAGYRNLFGSGRSGLLSESVELESVGLSFSDRRVAQSGGLLRTKFRIGANARIETDIDIAQSDNRDGRRELAIAYARAIGSPGELKIEARRRQRESGPARLTRSQARLQLTGSRSEYRWRMALRVYDEESGERGAGLFTRLRRRIPHNGQIDLWLDLSRWEPDGEGLRRFYGYIRLATPIEKTGALTLANKIAYRYDRRATVRSRIVFRVELEARW